jgi:solute carrier family 35 protein
MRLFSGFCFGLSSFLITIVNKSVLTVFGFPSYWILSFGQLLASVVILLVLHAFKVIKLRKYSNELIRRILPLPVFYAGTMILGLGGTKAISLPMFVELRKSAILMTLFLEFWLLGIRPARSIQIVVCVMILGSAIAMFADLAFSLEGYSMVFASNLISAFNNVYIKKKTSEEKLDNLDMVFYNSLVSILPVGLIIYTIGELDNLTSFKYWNDVDFLSVFSLSCIMGFILNYSIVLCTNYNSALTTTIVGCMKNIAITYLGMFFGGDYKFSWWNFVGLNISVLGSVLYVYVEISRNRKKDAVPKTEIA